MRPAFSETRRTRHVDPMSLDTQITSSCYLFFCLDGFKGLSRGSLSHIEIQASPNSTGFRYGIFCKSLSLAIFKTAQIFRFSRSFGKISVHHFLLIPGWAWNWMGNTRSFPCSCWILITTASLFISLYLLNNPSEMREKTPLHLEADWSLMGKDAWVPSIGGDVFC